VLLVTAAAADAAIKANGCAAAAAAAAAAAGIPIIHNRCSSRRLRAASYTHTHKSRITYLYTHTHTHSADVPTPLSQQVQFAAAQSLISLLDPSVALLPSMLPPHELNALIPPSATIYPQSNAPISPYQGQPPGRAGGARKEEKGGKGELDPTGEERMEGFRDRNVGSSSSTVRAGVVLPAARGALQARHGAEEEGEEAARGEVAAAGGSERVRESAHASDECGTQVRDTEGSASSRSI
jgi:hypothetical protein